MRKIRGLKLRNYLVRVSNWVQLKARVQTRKFRFRRSQAPSKQRVTGKLVAVCRALTNGAKALCSNKPNPSYVPVGGGAFGKETATVPKGHLAVYVGQKDDGEFHRILVPVVYFNHPLFGELLMEAEEEYGFEHRGGITIPCGFTKFQRVQTRIKSGSWRPLLLRR